MNNNHLVCPNRFIPNAVNINRPINNNDPVLINDGNININVSINNFKFLAFLINLRILRILNVLIAVIAVPTDTPDVLSIIIPKSDANTTIKSNTFHPSLNYKLPNATCLTTYSTLNIAVKNKFKLPNTCSSNGSGGYVFIAIIAVFATIISVIKVSNYEFLAILHNEFLYPSGGFIILSGVYFKNSF